MTKIFQIEKAEESTGFLLWKAHNQWQRKIRAMLKIHGLSHTQFIVLANVLYLSKQNPNLSQVEVSKQTTVDKMLVSKVLRALEKRELVLRKDHPSDTRAKIIMISKTGTKLLKKAMKDVEDFDRKYFSMVKNQKTFNQELKRLL